jgi:hypothetical protein
MILVISSPSSSTTGFLTLIFLNSVVAMFRLENAIAAGLYDCREACWKVVAVDERNEERKSGRVAGSMVRREEKEGLGVRERYRLKGS